MEGEPVQIIRETSRNILLRNRKKIKDEQSDVRRSLAKLRITESDVSAIANKLKSKSSISSSDLKLLQNALVDNVKNVEVVLNTHGALRGLVRELSGNDVSKQCAACSCLCNLALGEPKTCSIIAKAAGAYLVTALDSLTTQLAVSCAWTLGNLAGSGPCPCSLLVAQGAAPKLCDVTQRAGDGELQQAALYALTHAAFVMKDDLRPEHLHRIVESLSKIELNIDSSQLLFILSCHKDFIPDKLPEGYLRQIVEKLIVSIEHHLNICGNMEHSAGALVNPNSSSANSKRTIENKCRSSNSRNECCQLIYLIRILANLNSEKVYRDLSTYITSHNLVINIKRLLLDVDIKISLLWFLGNMMKCCGESDVFFSQLIQ